MAKEKTETETVATTREWNPSRTTPLADIQGTIDAWSRGAGATPATRATAPPRDYAAIQEAVDRITRRVKTRKVVVHETVTEYVEQEVPAEAAEATPAGSPEGVAELATVAKPAEEPERLGFFARRKAAKQAKDGPAAEAPAGAASTPVVEAAPRRAVTVADDAWDPGTAKAIEAPKALQSKAAKRTAGRKKAAKKKR